MQEQKLIKATLDVFARATKGLDDAEVFLELAEAEEDESVLADTAGELDAAEKDIGDMEFQRMLGGKFDPNPVIVSINSGQGGNDANEWAEMLLRMYLRFCERRGWKTELVERADGEEAGIKSATFVSRGEYAYGYLKAEAGVHRLVRISPFSGRRETSFAGVTCVPEIDDDIDVVIEDKDLRIDTYRSSGAGGQHVNKTDSAVRLTHIPTGVVVACQNERSQHKNKATAMRILRARLYVLEQQKRDEEMAKFAGAKKGAGFGAQDRSYVMAPYRMVKDLRTGVEKGNVDAVLDGDLDDFITAYLIQAGSGAEKAS